MAHQSNLTPFQYRPLEEPDLSDRLFRRPHRENALIEITNILADDISSLTAERVRQIEERWGVDFNKDFEDQRAEIFERYLAHCYSDFEIDPRERERLNQLIELLHLDDDQIHKIARPLQASTYREAVQRFIADYEVTPEEDERLLALRSGLMLDEDQAHEIETKETTRHIQQYIDQAVEDALISPDEEAAILRAAKALNVTLQWSDEYRKRWDRYRLYWDLQYGPLTPVTVRIRLQKTEQCYFSAPAVWFEERSRTRSVSYHGPTARIRLAKGVYWRAGNINLGRRTEQYMKRVDQGTIYFTNKRIIFTGDARSTNIRLTRVLDFHPSADGIEIVKDAGVNPIFRIASDIDIAAIVLNRVLAGDPALEGSDGDAPAG